MSTSTTTWYNLATQKVPDKHKKGILVNRKVRPSAFFLGQDLSSEPLAQSSKGLYHRCMKCSYLYNKFGLKYWLPPQEMFATTEIVCHQYYSVASNWYCIETFDCVRMCFTVLYWNGFSFHNWWYINSKTTESTQ